MIKKSIGVLQSRKVVGYLWLLAGVLMMVPSVLSDGHETSVGVGMMFLVLGIVALSRERKSWPLCLVDEQKFCTSIDCYWPLADPQPINR